MRSGGSGGGKLASWLWRAPRRALGRARDLYVRSITGCAGHLPPDAAFGYGYPAFAAPATPAMSRSSSLASSSASSRFAGGEEDMRELIRAASQRLAAERAAAAEPATVPRSQSVAMARIDEDRPCEFGGAGLVVFPRSQSCAVGAGRVGRRRGRVAAMA
ncbi:uncharacterized protein LOC121055016 [Oryza brachyantha]|uniref:uncharacterized protein LOC121055016 n=1 Tax=Oryza brachyantha TaxID=4533 RepID=UPI001ADBF8C8|nr:uncharacterized protein LOC121055016 [Oryza brachyantha]